MAKQDKYTQLRLKVTITDCDNSFSHSTETSAFNCQRALNRTLHNIISVLQASVVVYPAIVRGDICVYYVVFGVTCFMARGNSALGEYPAKEPAYLVVRLDGAYHETASAVAVARVNT